MLFRRDRGRWRKGTGYWKSVSLFGGCSALGWNVKYSNLNIGLCFLSAELSSGIQYYREIDQRST